MRFSEEAVSKDLVDCLTLDLTLDTIVAVEIWNAIGPSHNYLGLF